MHIFSMLSFYCFLNWILNIKMLKIAFEKTISSEETSLTAYPFLNIVYVMIALYYVYILYH